MSKEEEYFGGFSFGKKKREEENERVAQEIRELIQKDVDEAAASYIESQMPEITAKILRRYIDRLADRRMTNERLWEARPKTKIDVQFLRDKSHDYSSKFLVIHTKEFRTYALTAGNRGFVIGGGERTSRSDGNHFETKEDDVKDFLGWFLFDVPKSEIASKTLDEMVQLFADKAYDYACYKSELFPSASILGEILNDERYSLKKSIRDSVYRNNYEEIESYNIDYEKTDITVPNIKHYTVNVHKPSERLKKKMEQAGRAYAAAFKRRGFVLLTDKDGEYTPEGKTYLHYKDKYLNKKWNYEEKLEKAGGPQKEVTLLSNLKKVVEREELIKDTITDVVDKKVDEVIKNLKEYIETSKLTLESTGAGIQTYSDDLPSFKEMGMLCYKPSFMPRELTKSTDKESVAQAQQSSHQSSNKAENNETSKTHTDDFSQARS